MKRYQKIFEKTINKLPEKFLFNKYKSVFKKDLLFVEALTPKERQQYKKYFDPERYKDIFQRKNRIYLPVGNVNPVQDKIEQFLSRFGYKVVDFNAGTLSKTGDKRQFSIGKVLNQTNPALLKMYTDQKAKGGDNAEQSKGYNLMVVISRHPYDIAAMSTDQAWNSCMNIRTGINKKYVTCDVKEGTLVAYLTTKDDTKLKNPVGRMLIKPFVNTETKERVLVLERRAYGKGQAEITDVVEKWLKGINKVSPGEYKLLKNLYADSQSTVTFDQMYEYKDIIDAMKDRVTQVATSYLKGNSDFDLVSGFDRLSNYLDVEVLKKMATKISTNPKGAILEKEYPLGSKVDIDMSSDSVIKNLLSGIPEKFHTEALKQSGIQ